MCKEEKEKAVPPFLLSRVAVFLNRTISFFVKYQTTHPYPTRSLADLFSFRCGTNSTIAPEYPSKIPSKKQVVFFCQTNKR
jgi:hypothetical protein